MPKFVLRLTALLLMGLLTAGAAQAESPFVRPAELEPDIAFWIRVYTEVGTNGGLLHDERYLGVVYEVLQFPEGMSPQERGRRVQDAKARYSALLRRFANGGAPKDAEERRVRALWPQNTSGRALTEAAERIRFQLGQANRFREGLVRAGAYEAHIAETLANLGLPAELAALPHVESSFNPAAYSHAGAAGLWQFMRSTGRRYMRIDAVVDERMDPYRATIAAAQLLEFNYKLLGTWPLALTAYNHGAAGMRRAKEKMATDDIVTIVRKHSSRTFGFASRNYYIAFLAALDVDRDAEKYFGPIERQVEVKTRSVAVPAFVPVATLERSLGIERQVLRSLNPSLTAAVWSGDRYVPRGFELRLPMDGPAEPAVKLASLDRNERYDEQKADVLHRVVAGDTLSGIAAKHGTTVAVLMQLNDLRSAHNLRRGQMLRLPTRGEGAAVVAAVAPPPSTAAAKPPARPAAPAASSRPATPAAVLADAEAQPEEIVVTETEIARNERAEPVSAAQADELGPKLVPGVQSALSADPSDYTVADDGSIEVQVAETLGHYADWLGIRASRLRELNKLRFGTPVVIGQRLKIDVSRVSADQFVQRRSEYHQRMQEEFFAANRIVDTEVYVVRRGESLWLIAQKYPRVPIWLLRQYNPDVDFNDVRPRTQLILPRIESATAPQQSVGGPP